MTQATINGIPFFVNPTSIEWSYNVKLSSQPTLGGMVVQLFGWSMGDLVISGSFGSVDRQASFFQAIDSIADAQTPIVDANGANAAKPVRFLWAEQEWDFWVFVRDLKQTGSAVAIESTVQNFSPKYTLTLFVFEDNGQIVKAATNNAMVAYMKRLSAGLGWAQSEWNGPVHESDLQELLKGQTFVEYAFTQYGLQLPSDISASQVPTPLVGPS